MEQEDQTEKGLKSLFQWVSFKKLQELRLVCKYWNRLSSDELRKRSKLIRLDHANDPKKVKEFYNLELSVKNQDLSAKLPIFAIIRSNALNDWEFLKDIATHEGWRTRVSVLQLSGFWVSDLNRLIPFLLDQLPSVTALDLHYINMYENVGNAIIPRDFNIPEVSPTKRFPLTSLRATFFPLDTSDAASGTLDPRFLRQCHLLKEFDALIWASSKETIGFFELLNGIHSEEVGFLASCDKISLLVRSETFDEKGPLAILAQFVNNAQPASLRLEIGNPCDMLNLVYFLILLKVEPRAFSVNVPPSGDTLCYSNWLMKTLKKFKIFSQLEELCLKPDTDTLESHEVPEEVARDFEHNLDKVTTLKISLDPEKRYMEGEKFKCLLEDAAHHLRNVTRLELVDLKYRAIFRPKHNLTFNFKTLFEGITQLRGLREILVDVEDFNGKLDTTEIYMIGRCGMLEPLSLLAGSTVQTLTLNVKVEYNSSLEKVLLALLKGYEPEVQLNLNLKTYRCELKKYRYSKEELKETLDKICKRSP